MLKPVSISSRTSETFYSSRVLLTASMGKCYLLLVLTVVVATVPTGSEPVNLGTTNIDQNIHPRVDDKRMLRMSDPTRDASDEERITQVFHRIKLAIKHTFFPNLTLEQLARVKSMKKSLSLKRRISHQLVKRGKLNLKSEDHRLELFRDHIFRSAEPGDLEAYLKYYGIKNSKPFFDQFEELKRAVAAFQSVKSELREVHREEAYERAVSFKDIMPRLKEEGLTVHGLETMLKLNDRPGASFVFKLDQSKLTSEEVQLYRNFMISPKP